MAGGKHPSYWPAAQRRTDITLPSRTFDLTDGFCLSAPCQLSLLRSLCTDHPSISPESVPNPLLDFSIRLGGRGGRDEIATGIERSPIFISVQRFSSLGYNSVFHVPLVIELYFSLSISVEGRAIVIKLSNETLFHPRYSLYHGNSPFSELVLHYIPFYRPFLKIIKKIRRTIIKQKFCIPILPLKIGQKSTSPP